MSEPTTPERVVFEPLLNRITPAQQFCTIDYHDGQVRWLPHVTAASIMQSGAPNALILLALWYATHPEEAFR